MSKAEDVWTVVLYELIKHVELFGTTNVMEYKGKEFKAFTTGLGMVSILCKKMIDDIKESMDEIHEEDCGCEDCIDELVAGVASMGPEDFE